MCTPGTNVLRRLLIQKYKLNDDFELSQNYLFFYGKLVNNYQVEEWTHTRFTVTDIGVRGL